MKLKDQLKLQKDIEVPYHVWRMFGTREHSGFIRVSGNQASFGEDFGTEAELKQALEWYVAQLGGKVKW